jgi:ribonucleoside-diphosphate reductase alpha chain
MTDNLEYSILASRIIISNLHKKTTECFSNVMERLYNNIDKLGNPAPVISDIGIEFIRKHKDILNESIDYSRDYMFNYFGFKTLEKSYLMKLDNNIVERPQHLYMRVAIQVNLGDIENVIKTYHLISQHLLTFASPTMFNSLSRLGNLSSCFLIGTEDSVEGIFKTMTDVAKISKVGGGIGLHIDNIRSKGSVIRGTNGHSDGIIPMLKVYNEVSLYINQCFTPDTWVYSKCGPKQMKDINTNDHLITIDGSFKKVNEVIINKIDKEILEIRATNTLFPVKVTKEHELYLIKDQKKITNFSVIKNRLNKQIIKPDFYDASKLNENDLVGFPLPTYIQDNDNDDLEFYKLYGLMLGDGHHCNNEYGITLNDIDKLDEQIFVKNYLNKKGLNYWISNHTGCSKIGWYDTNNGKIGITRDMMYDSNNKKRIQEDFLHLPKNKILKIIEGLLKSDGSNLKELYFSNTSQELIMQMRYLFLRLGILTSGCVKDNRGKFHITKDGKTITTKQIAYSLRIPKHPNLKSIIKFKKDGKYFKYFEWNNILWGRIKSINKIHYSGDVYDFNMIDNHNYLTDMGLVHNSGKRKGSFAIYLSPSHPDIIEFLDLRKNQGKEEFRARDLFYAMWMSDLYMNQVKKDGDWYLMDPDECPGLNDVYGEEYENLYWKYVEEKRYRKKIKAQEIWTKILESQIETGGPYILYKDQINKKSNQKNIGVIKSSNLCVAPETQILTSKGYYTIKDLENTEVEVWNGQNFSKTIVRKTGINQELLKVKLSNGSEIECTPYHKFYIATGKRPADYPMIKQIEAKELKKDMQLIKSNYPIIKEGLDNFPYPYIHGLYSADGTLEAKKQETFQCKYKSLDGHKYCGFHIKIYNDNDNDHTPTIYCQAIVGEGYPRITLYGEKKKLIKYIPYIY